MHQFKASAFGAGQLRRNLASRFKSLIFQGFAVHPEFLWITLLISTSDPAPALENQGFRWNARKKSKVQLL
jgi:hypothetical protein